MARRKPRKRQDGLYETTIKIGVNPETGRPIRKHLYAKTQKELEAKKAEFKKSMELGLSADRNITFSEYAAKWFTLTKSGKSASTQYTYKNILRNHVKCIADKRLDKITKSDILMQLNHSAGHLATQKLTLLLVQQVLANAVDDGLVIRNVAENISLDPEKKTEKRRQLTDFELDCIASADLDQEERCYISLLLYTGMRKGEVFALNRDSIDFKANVIHVTRKCDFTNWKETIVNAPKTAAGFRDIPLLEDLKPILADYMSSLDTDYLFTRKDPETGECRVLKKTEVTTLWKHIYEKLNAAAVPVLKKGAYPIIPPLADPMQGISPHYFRHNFACMLRKSDVDLKGASRIMGHSNISTTLDTYTHITEHDITESANKINLYLKDA